MNGRVRAARAAWLRAGIAISALGLFAGCIGTTIGLPNPGLRDSLEYGPRREVSFCVLLDEGVTAERAQSLLEAWNRRAAPYYDLYVRAARFDSLPRSGWTKQGIFEQIRSAPLPPDCQRVLYFVAPSVPDFLYETAALFLPLPLVRGSAGGRYGFVYAKVRTPVGLLFELSYFGSLRSVLVHELYHFWGCPHALLMRRCYQDIQRTKGIEPGRPRERDAAPGS